MLFLIFGILAIILFGSIVALIRNENRFYELNTKKRLLLTIFLLLLSIMTLLVLFIILMQQKLLLPTMISISLLLVILVVIKVFKLLCFWFNFKSNKVSRSIIQVQEKKKQEYGK